MSFEVRYGSDTTGNQDPDETRIPYRRLFIVRKDLDMTTGKITAQISHCAELYWLTRIKDVLLEIEDHYYADMMFDKEEVDNYIKGDIVKTIVEARNKNHLLKAKTLAEELGLVEGVDFGFVYDLCLTELTPEEEDGTCLTSFWTRPLPDDLAHKISKKYQLFKG